MAVAIKSIIRGNIFKYLRINFNILLKQDIFAGNG